MRGNNYSSETGDAPIDQRAGGRVRCVATSSGATKRVVSRALRGKTHGPCLGLSAGISFT